MASIGIWKHSNSDLIRLSSASIARESELEDMIERDPSLVQTGLIVVGRQFHTDAGHLDLLALDPQGRWVIIEIKKGTLKREAIAQVIDYASAFQKLSEDDLKSKVQDYLTRTKRNYSLSDILSERDALNATDPKEREIVMFVVGAFRDPSLDRLASFLSDNYRVPISVVSFQVFGDQAGGYFLVRELAEPEFFEEITQHQSEDNQRQLFMLSERNGFGDQFRAIFDKATSLDIYPRTHKASIMYTPSANRSRMLFTIWARYFQKGMHSYIGITPFNEFYGIPVKVVEDALGREGWRYLSANDVEGFINGLESLRPYIQPES